IRLVQLEKSRRPRRAPLKGLRMFVSRAVAPTRWSSGVTRSRHLEAHEDTVSGLDMRVLDLDIALGSESKFDLKLRFVAGPIDDDHSDATIAVLIHGCYRDDKALGASAADWDLHSHRGADQICHSCRIKGKNGDLHLQRIRRIVRGGTNLLHNRIGRKAKLRDCHPDY